MRESIHSFFGCPVGCFHYLLFRHFPHYFFITNLLGLPFIAIIIILQFCSPSYLLSFLNLGFIQIVYNVVVVFIQFLINTVLQIVYFFESLPFSVLEGFHISVLQVVLIFAIILSLSLFILHNRTSQLIALLVTVVLLLFTHSFSYLKEPVNQFFVYNSYSESDMGYMVNGEKIALPISTNQIVAHPTATIVLLTENSFKSKVSIGIPVGFLMWLQIRFSVQNYFLPIKEIVIDASIGRYSAAKIKNKARN